MKGSWPRRGFLVRGITSPKLFNEYLIILQVTERSWDYKLSVVLGRRHLLQESVSRGIVYIIIFFFQSNGTTEHQVESFIRKKLESLLRESQIRDKEDPDSFTVRALLKATHEGLNTHLKQVNNLSWTLPLPRGKKMDPPLRFLSTFSLWNAPQMSLSILVKSEQQNPWAK